MLKGHDLKPGAKNLLGFKISVHPPISASRRFMLSSDLPLCSLW